MMRHKPGRGRLTAAAGSIALLVSACTGGGGGSASPVSGSTGAGSPTSLAQGPPPQPPPQLGKTAVDDAVAKLDGIVKDTMAKTGVPGMAVAVVRQDQVVYLKGSGLRQVGKPDTVSPDTVFQLASVSKPLASTVVAGAVGQKTVSWDDPVVKHDRGFALKDPWTSDHVTVADLFSHRSGLPDHAGDLLEDLGYDRDYVLAHLRDDPLAPFRASYAYTNFGLTEAAVAVAKAKSTTWEDLSADLLYKPLGMHSTSSRFADYDKASDKAVPHVKVNDSWQAKYTRDPDAQSPAGGASSSVRDLAQWVRLQLGGGKVDGKQIIDADALERTHLPAALSSPPAAPGGRTGFYGLGWNVSYDDHGRLRLGHSGAFSLGAATAVMLLPTEQLGIVALTNGEPVGAPEAVTETFLDIAQNGSASVDWLGFFGKLIAASARSDKSKVDYSKPPAAPGPAKPDASYVGTYGNGYYGPLTVSAQDGGLVMELGPKRMRFPLQHYDNDTFSYETEGEDAAGRSGVTFGRGASDTATKVTVESLDHTGLGTFNR
jgi:CubicO group peptidase (beta-lactamase class C family)